MGIIKTLLFISPLFALTLFMFFFLEPAYPAQVTGSFSLIKGAIYFVPSLIAIGIIFFALEQSGRLGEDPRYVLIRAQKKLSDGDYREALRLSELLIEDEYSKDDKILSGAYGIRKSAAEAYIKNTGREVTMLLKSNRIADAERRIRAAEDYAKAIGIDISSVINSDDVNKLQKEILDYKTEKWKEQQDT
ncbi:MAG TPA: hypothetical protein VJH34_00645 [archaeon]|nr:hypothetical protein [archaeon]